MPGFFPSGFAIGFSYLSSSAGHIPLDIFAHSHTANAHDSAYLPEHTYSQKQITINTSLSLFSNSQSVLWVSGNTHDLGHDLSSIQA